MNPSRQESHDDGLGRLVRRVFSSGPTAEERLEQLLAERRRELDETAARFDATMADLERREELLRDSRASVERLLRLGRGDLEARENELTSFLREVTEREARLAEAEADLARRKQEVGAVELKRAALERREHELDAREAELDLREQELAARDDRETRPVDEEPTPPPELPLAATEPASGTPSSAPPEAPPSGQRAPERPEPTSTRPGLLFVPGHEYRLLEVSLPTGATAGAAVDVEGEEYVVARIGPSPLPGDRRRCAYLVRGLPRESRGSS